MISWFEVKVRYTKQLDNGALKRVNEPYVLHAFTFGQAEERIYEELGDIIRGEFHVSGIARANYHDINPYDDADLWFKGKIQYENFDADLEKASNVTQYVLVTANSVKEATDRIAETYEGLLVDFTIKSVIETKIIDVFPAKDAELEDKEVSRRPIEEGEDVSHMEVVGN